MFAAWGGWTVAVVDAVSFLVAAVLGFVFGGAALAGASVLLFGPELHEAYLRTLVAYRAVTSGGGVSVVPQAARNMAASRKRMGVDFTRAS